MLNAYLFLYSKFFFFTSAVNTSKIYASIAAVGILSGFPILNIMVLLTNVFSVNYNKYKNVYVISFVIVYIVNLLFIILTKAYEDLDLKYTVSKKSRTVSNTLVALYLLTSFVHLFV